MDNLTHTAIGLFLSRAGLNRWTPLATPILLLAANAPDADVVTAAGGSLNYLHFHRHLTHSLFMAPVMALVAVAVVALFQRKRVKWLGAWAAAMIAVFSHLLLDLTNVYGVRLMLPFSERWYRLDLTNVVDLWIWGALLIGIAGPFLGRLVGSEISSGAAKVRHYGRGWAWVALLFVLLYNAGRSVLHERAMAVIGARTYQGTEAVRVAAMPNVANPLIWKAVVETGSFYAVQEFNLASEYDPTRSSIFHKPEPDPALEPARRTLVFQEFLRFSQYPLWRVSPVPDPENGKLVQIYDMRFGTPVTPGFMATALVDGGLRVLRTTFEFGRVRPR